MSAAGRPPLVAHPRALRVGPLGVAHNALNRPTLIGVCRESCGPDRGTSVIGDVHGDAWARGARADHAVNVATGGTPDWLRSLLRSELDGALSSLPRRDRRDRRDCPAPQSRPRRGRPAQRRRPRLHADRRDAWSAAARRRAPAVRRARPCAGGRRHCRPHPVILVQRPLHLGSGIDPRRRGPRRHRQPHQPDRRPAPPRRVRGHHEARPHRSSSTRRSWTSCPASRSRLASEQGRGVSSAASPRSSRSPVCASATCSRRPRWPAGCATAARRGRSTASPLPWRAPPPTIPSGSARPPGVRRPTAPRCTRAVTAALPDVCVHDGAANFLLLELAPGRTRRRYAPCPANATASLFVRLLDLSLADRAPLAPHRTRWRGEMFSWWRR